MRSRVEELEQIRELTKRVLEREYERRRLEEAFLPEWDRLREKVKEGLRKAECLRREGSLLAELAEAEQKVEALKRQLADVQDLDNG